jgi:ABC-2 type transport system ATP-binding protein
MLDNLGTAGIPVVRVSSHRPTLDDVFMSVTANGSRTTQGVNA